MNINTNSLHYKFWALTHKAWGLEPPTHTNLCSYVQRMIWMPLWILIAYPFILTFLYLIVAPIAILLGWKSSWIFSSIKNNDDYFTPYEGLQIGSWVIYPGYLVIPAFLIGLEYMGWKHAFFPTLTVHLVLLGFIAVFAFFAFFDTDGPSLIREWVSAKTQGICPLITFNNSNEREQL